MKHFKSYFILSCISFSLMACGTLKTPQYKSQSRTFKTPSRGYASYNTNVPFQLRLPTEDFQFVRGFKSVPGRRPHKGLDLDGVTGDPINAAHSGIVVYAGTGFTGYGKMVLIEFNSTWATLYAHLNRFRVQTGDIVKVGDRIGDMGSTGRSTGSHLHFELLKNRTPIDPMPYFRKSHFLTSN